MVRSSSSSGSSPVSADARMRYDGFAAAIRKIGPEVCILSSDLGRMGNPLPVDSFGAFLTALRRSRLQRADIARMARENPARLLGLN